MNFLSSRIRCIGFLPIGLPFACALLLSVACGAEKREVATDEPQLPIATDMATFVSVLGEDIRWIQCDKLSQDCAIDSAKEISIDALMQRLLAGSEIAAFEAERNELHEQQLDYDRRIQSLEDKDADPDEAAELAALEAKFETSEAIVYDLEVNIQQLEETLVDYPGLPGIEEQIEADKESLATEMTIYTAIQSDLQRIKARKAGRRAQIDFLKRKKADLEPKQVELDSKIATVREAVEKARDDLLAQLDETPKELAELKDADWLGEVLLGGEK